MTSWLIKYCSSNNLQFENNNALSFSFSSVLSPLVSQTFHSICSCFCLCRNPSLQVVTHIPWQSLLWLKLTISTNGQMLNPIRSSILHNYSSSIYTPPVLHKTLFNMTLYKTYIRCKKRKIIKQRSQIWNSDRIFFFNIIKVR